MSMLTNSDSVEKTLKAFIERELIKEGEVLIENALDDMRTKLRKSLVELTATVIKTSYSMERFGNELCIRVNLAEPKK